jgi:hypothetical protein
MNEVRKLGARSLADGLGLFGSAACAIHCLLTPLVILIGASLPASFLTDESFHRAILWVLLPSGVVAFGIGCSRHRDWLVFALGALGMAGLGLSVTWLHEALGDAGERAATVLSSASLAVAHIRNWKLCHAANCAHDCKGLG